MSRPKALHPNAFRVAASIKEYLAANFGDGRLQRHAITQEEYRDLLELQRMARHFGLPRSWMRKAVQEAAEGLEQRAS